MSLTPLPQALEQVLRSIEPVARIEELPLSLAGSRVLLDDLSAPLALPPFANSAMDGIALHHASASEEGEVRLELVGRSEAGRPWEGRLEAGQALRILTGAALPRGADTVVPQEELSFDGGQVTLRGPLEAHRFVREAGSDVPAGQCVLRAGTLLQPEHLALAASLGLSSLPVRARPRVVLLCTGDELVAPGQELGAGQIYDANGPLLEALIGPWGGELLRSSPVADTRAAVAEALERAAVEADLIVTLGGVSVGDTDFVRDCVQELGELSLWGVAIRPGKPLAWGSVCGVPFLGLPGNPVSAWVTARLVLWPLLSALAGRPPPQPNTVTATLLTPLPATQARATVSFFSLTSTPKNSEPSAYLAQALPSASHRLSTLAQAQALLLRPAQSPALEAGARCSLELLRPSCLPSINPAARVPPCTPA